MKSIGVLMMGPSYGYLEQELGRRFTVFRHETPPTPRGFLMRHAESIHAVVGVPSEKIDAELIDALPNLTIVSCFSVGVDYVDLVKCEEKGIRVTNTPDVVSAEVADTAIALMIAVLRRTCVCDNFVRNKEWLRNKFPLTTKLSGRRVGIIGLGRVGSAIAKRVEAFGCPISYNSRSEKQNKNYKYYSTITELASNCDILVVACDLNPETRHIVNREVIQALGAEGVLINVGRGGHADEHELVSALIEGRLGGAGLDVFQNEPHVPEALFSLENVVLSPHVGTSTVETEVDITDLILRNLDAHFSGKPLLTPVV